MKISYCTNCHNRLWQLQQTIQHNLQFTVSGKVELCVLAYNDITIEPYLIENFKPYIDDGRLKIKTHSDDKPYTFGYVKNLSHREASGDVLFNLDSDNYIDGVHEDLLTLGDSELLITDKSHLSDGRGGRIGITRRTFNTLGGYRDGQRKPDDEDLITRAIHSGLILRRAKCNIPPLENQPVIK